MADWIKNELGEMICSACKRRIPCVIVQKATVNRPFHIVEEIRRTPCCPWCGECMEEYDDVSEEPLFESAKDYIKVLHEKASTYCASADFDELVDLIDFQLMDYANRAYDATCLGKNPYDFHVGIILREVDIHRYSFALKTEEDAKRIIDRIKDCAERALRIIEEYEKN